LAVAAEHVRRADPDRFLCTQFLPAPVRAPVLAALAVNQELARAVCASTETMLARIRLQWWREALDAIMAGNPPAHAIAQALATHHPRPDALVPVLEAWEEEIDLQDAEADGRRRAAAAAHTEGLVQAAIAGLVLADKDRAPDGARAAGAAWGLAARVLPRAGQDGGWVRTQAAAEVAAAWRDPLAGHRRTRCLLLPAVLAHRRLARGDLPTDQPDALKIPAMAWAVWMGRQRAA